MRNAHLMAGTALAAAFMLVAPGCEEKGPLEKAGEKIDDAAEETGEAIEEAGEEIKDAADDAKDKVDG